MIELPNRLGPEAIAHSRFIEGWNACLDAIAVGSDVPVFIDDQQEEISNDKT